MAACHILPGLPWKNRKATRKERESMKGEKKKEKVGGLEVKIRRNAAILVKI